MLSLTLIRECIDFTKINQVFIRFDDRNKKFHAQLDSVNFPGLRKIKSLAASAVK